MGTYYWGDYAGTWLWIDPRYKLIMVGMIQHRSNGMPDVRSLSRSLTYRRLWICRKENSKTAVTREGKTKIITTESLA